MDVVYMALLLKLRKSNKAAKLRMAKSYGFETVEAFERHLTGEDPASNPKSAKKKEVKPVEETPTDMVIAFDTTGSMRSYIGSVRNHVQETIGGLFTNTPNLKLKIVAFGDYCDMIGKGKFGNAYQETDLTNDKDILINFVKNAKNTSGGDTEEFYELVLHKILRETQWRDGSNKAILLIADESPHPLNYKYENFVEKRIDWKDEANKAKEMGVKIDTLRIHPYVKWYESLSKITNGTCMDFKSAGKTQEIVKASTYLNSRSAKGISETKALYRSAVADGDMELVGAYKGMAADRGINLDE